MITLISLALVVQLRSPYFSVLVNSINVLLTGQPLSWASVEKTMEETPELWKPDLWSKNSETFPLRDDFDVEHVMRRSPGRFGITKEIEEGRSQPEV
jgi:hypothetical protein